MPQLPPWPPVRHPVGSNRAIVVAEVWQRVDVVYVFWLRFLARQGSALGSARGIDTKEATNGHHTPECAARDGELRLADIDPKIQHSAAGSDPFVVKFTLEGVHLL